MTRIEQADKFAEQAHEGQFRRDGKTPYISHPRAVARRVAAVWHDEDLIIASLFHDIEEHREEKVKPEHPEYNLISIHEQFGSGIAYLVSELTDEYTKPRHPHLNRAARKQRERERYGKLCDDVALIKLADILSNLNDLDKTDKGFAGLYVREKELCLPFLERLKDPRNISLYALALAELEKAKKRAADAIYENK